VTASYECNEKGSFRVDNVMRFIKRQELEKKRDLCEMLAPLVVVPPLPPQNQPASGAPAARQQPARGARPTLQQQLQGS
jgi:hypothetical protein